MSELVRPAAKANGDARGHPLESRANQMMLGAILWHHLRLLVEVETWAETNNARGYPLA